MSNSTNDMSEKLVQYLDGDLPAEENAEVEKQLASDPALREELERLQLAREAVRSYGLKQEVSAIHGEMMQELQPPVRSIATTRRIIRYTMSVAAGLLVIIAGITVYNYLSLSPGRLFRDHYRSYELSTVRGGGGTAMSLLEKAYREKKYEDVIATRVDRPFTIPEEFLRAMSFTELDDNANAINSYREVLAKNMAAGTHILQDEAEYYLALVCVRSRQYDTALEWLDKIKGDPAHKYHEKVTGKLIRKVKSLR